MLFYDPPTEGGYGSRGGRGGRSRGGYHSRGYEGGYGNEAMPELPHFTHSAPKKEEVKVETKPAAKEATKDDPFGGLKPRDETEYEKKHKGVRAPTQEEESKPLPPAQAPVQVQEAPAPQPEKQHVEYQEGYAEGEEAEEGYQGGYRGRYSGSPRRNRYGRRGGRYPSRRPYYGRGYYGGGYAPYQDPEGENYEEEYVPAQEEPVEAQYSSKKKYVPKTEKRGMVINISIE